MINYIQNTFTGGIAVNTKEKFIDIFYQKGGSPSFCYRSGNAVYEETFIGGNLISSGWSAGGYPPALLKGFPWRLDRRNFTEPSVFNLDIDGCSLDFGLNFVDFSEEETEGGKRTCITLRSTLKPVEIKAITLLDGTQVFTRKLEIKNLSDKPLCISRLSIFSGGVESMDRSELTFSNDVEKLYSIGYFESDKWAREGLFTWRDLQPEETRIDTRFSRDRFRHPLIFIRNNVTGKIWFAQIGWSGGCRFSLDLNAQKENDTSHLSFKAEISSRNPIFVIAPNETFVTPEVHIGIVHGDFDTAVNEMHSHTRKSVLKTPSPCLIGCGMGAEHDMDVATSKNFIDQFAAMGGEVFIVDAGWECPPDEQTKWGDYTGTIIPNPDRYPDGISEISDYCHEKGLKFGLWVDIENAGILTATNKNHPEWRADNIFGEKSGHLMDMSNPGVAEYCENELARIIEEYGLDLLRVDHNADSRDYFNMRDTGNGIECVAMRHHLAVYKMYENLKKRFPDVVFENCAGGGARTDLGMMKNFNHTWVSDCQVMPYSVMITNGMTAALPPERVDRLFAGMGCHRTGSFEAHMRNTMLTHMSLNVVSPSEAVLNTEQIAFVKHCTDIYKEFIRPFINESKVYHHTPETLKNINGFSVLEIAAPDLSAGAIAVFALTGVTENSVKIFPKGIDASKTYEITLDNSGVKFTVSGAELYMNGLEVRIPSSLASELILYKSVE